MSLSPGLNKINLFEKSTILPAKSFEPQSFKCIPHSRKWVIEILSLEIKPNLFNTHCSLKLMFTYRVKRVNTMLSFGKIPDFITFFTPKLLQDFPMLIISSVNFSVFILSSVYLYHSSRYVTKQHQANPCEALVEFNNSNSYVKYLEKH